MTRRTIGLLITLALGLLVVSLAVAARPSAPVPRIGLLCLFSPALRESKAESFRQGLRELGYMEGQHMLLESRWAEGHQERLAELAADLVRLQVAVIVTESTLAALAAKQATDTIPLVMTTGGDPVAAGLVASLAQPGGSVTGLTMFTPELSGQRLQLLTEAAPQTLLVAVLWNAANPAHARLQVIQLYYQGWEKVSISRFLHVSRPTVDAWIRRFEAEHFAGLIDKSRAPKAPVRKIWLPLMVQVCHLQKAHPDAGEFRIWSLLTRADVSVRTTGRVIALNRLV